jgi:outer membrane immunogenic protein
MTSILTFNLIHKEILSAALFGMALLASDAQAADVEETAEPFNWSGFYLGAVAAGGILDTTLSDSDENIVFGSFDISDWGWAAGLTAGNNWHLGAIVLGIETDISWSGFEINEYDGNYWDIQHDRSWDWFATIRARAGVAIENALVFVSGGAAFVDVDFTAYDPPNNCLNANGYCLEETKVGLAFGAGAEYGVTDNLSFKLEGLWISLPTDAVDDVVDNEEDNYHVTSSAAMARLGLNLHF